MASWRVALRVARRDARRARGRTALVVVMIGLPVLALVFAAAVFDMQRLTPQERVTRVIGSADGAVHYGQRIKAKDSGAGAGVVPETRYDASAGYILGSEAGPHDPAALLPYLPAGSSATATWEADVDMRTAGGTGKIMARGIDPTSPATQGLVRLFRGRMPRTDTEVTASSMALDRLGARLGDTVTTAKGLRFTVVGVTEVSGAIRESLVFLPSAPIPDANGYWLVKQPGPMTWAEIQSLNRHGFDAQSRQLMLDPPKMPGGQETIAGLSPFGLGTVVAGLGLLEVVLLAGPAFAVGARRRQRQLALVGANGGTPAVLRRIVLADGLVSGAVAGVAATAIGLAAAFGLRGQLEVLVFHQRFGGYRVDLWWVAGIGALAVVIGVLGAAVPAFSAARQDIVAALAGRRGVHRSRQRWWLLGAGLVAGGGLLAAAGAYGHRSPVTVAGLCVGEFGLVLCTPVIVGQIARLSRYLPLSPRIALRDVARRRTASAPAISAVMAAVAGSIALTVYLGVSDQSQVTFIPSAPLGSVVVTTTGWNTSKKPADDAVPKITAALEDVFPGATPVPVTTLVCPSVTFGCSAQAAAPLDQRCPYYPGPNLSKATIRRAKADPRCDYYSAGGIGSYDTGGEVVTDDPAVVSAMTGLRGAALDSAVATLRAGGALVPDASDVEDGQALVSLRGLLWTEDGTTPEVSGLAPGMPPDELDIRVPGYAVPVGAQQPILSPALLGAKALETAKPTTRVGHVILMPAAPATQAQLDHLRAELTGVTDGAYIEHLPVHHPSPVPLILAIAAGIVALGAAAIATGLAAADSRTDLTTLAAVGAAPRVRRSLSLAQSGIIAGLGSVLGAVAGFGAAVAVITGINQQYASVWPSPDPIPIHVPWTNFIVSLIAVPAVAMLGAGLLTRSRLPSERRAV